MNIRNWGEHATPAFLSECAVAADQSGLDAIWFNDHIGLPPSIGNNDSGVPDMGNIVDPLSFGSFLAAVTKRIRFGTAVLVLPYRPPLVTNKLIASIQLLSNNRFLLGIGPGYLEEEFRALGVQRKQRGRITDDTLAFLHASSKSTLIESNGQALELKPALPLPPIYVGGKADIAIPRALKYGNGWMPVGQTPAELQPAIKRLQDDAAAQNRGAMEVVAMKTLPLDELNAAQDLSCAYRDAGVTHLVHTQSYDSPAQYGEVVSTLDETIRGVLA